MYAKLVLDKALEITTERHPDGFVSSDATFLAAVLCQLFGPKSEVILEPKDIDISHHTVDHERIKIAVAELSGRRVQCKDVFQRAFGRASNSSEATQVGYQLRALGYQMKRYGGKNLYQL